MQAVHPCTSTSLPSNMGTSARLISCQSPCQQSMYHAVRTELSLLKHLPIDGSKEWMRLHSCTAGWAVPQLLGRLHVLQAFFKRLRILLLKYAADITHERSAATPGCKCNYNFFLLKAHQSRFDPYPSIACARLTAPSNHRIILCSQSGLHLRALSHYEQQLATTSRTRSSWQD